MADRLIYKRLFFITAFVFLVVLFVGIQTVSAAATSTIRGKAWWGDQYKYVFFNCLDSEAGDRLDFPENLFSLPEPRGFHFSVEPCQSVVFRTYIDDENRLSGSAWNYSKGSLSFDAVAPDYSFNLPAAGNCPSCTAANNCSACYNEVDQKLYGYAKIEIDNTWIRLDSGLTPPVRLQSWDISNSVYPGHGVQPGDFIGYASTPVGDLSFNCVTEGGGEGTCDTRAYKVYVHDAQVGHLVAPDWDYVSACSTGALTARLSWQLKSGTQSGFELVVGRPDTNTFSTSTGNYTCWTGPKYDSGAGQYVISNSIVSPDPNCGNLEYGKNYYWWIRLYYDNNTRVTKWYQYGANDGHIGDNDEETQGDPDSNQRTFTTYKHEFPIPYFNYSPEDVIVGTTTDFTSVGSKYFSTASPSLPQSCAGSNCHYQWSTSDAGDIISASTAATTTIIFHRATNTTVYLYVSDNDNYTCSTSTSINVNYGLPIWREVKPK